MIYIRWRNRKSWLLRFNELRRFPVSQKKLIVFRKRWKWNGSNGSSNPTLVMFVFEKSCSCDRKALDSPLVRIDIYSGYSGPSSNVNYPVRWISGTNRTRCSGIILGFDEMSRVRLRLNEYLKLISYLEIIGSSRFKDKKRKSDEEQNACIREVRAIRKHAMDTNVFGCCCKFSLRESTKWRTFAVALMYHPSS